MSRRENLVIFSLFAVLTAIPVALLLLLVFWPTPRPISPASAAPDWLHELCRTQGSRWRPWREIVIHHSGANQGNFAAINRYHQAQRHWESAGYHFIVGNGTRSGNGEIEVCPRWREQQIGAHCRGHNEEAIGICLIGNFDLNGRKPSVAQLLALAQLTAYLSLQCDIPRDGIRMHRDMSDASTRCPGRNFPTDEFLDLFDAVRKNFLLP